MASHNSNKIKPVFPKNLHLHLLLPQIKLYMKYVTSKGVPREPQETIRLAREGILVT